MISRGRLTFNDPGWGEIVGVFSVEDNGWVTKWRDHDPERVEAMYPPTAVLRVGFNDPAPKPQPVVTDAAVQAFSEVLAEHGYDSTEFFYKVPVRDALAAAFTEVGL